MCQTGGIAEWPTLRTGEKRTDRHRLRSDSESNEEHGSEERNRGYVREGIGEPTAEAEESVAVVAVDADREGWRVDKDSP